MGYRVFGAVSCHSTYIRKKSPVANIGMLSSPLRHLFSYSRVRSVFLVSPLSSLLHTPLLFDSNRLNSLFHMPDPILIVMG